MTEIVIYGRGGQGGVTLAKLIAEAYFLKGKFVQAFGVYAAERSGAPLQAFVRIDDQEITNHNQISEPDHVIVLDRTLIGPPIAAGLKPGGWIIVNTAEPAESLSNVFPGRRVAAIDATAVAVAHGLGTRAVPIVNTTIFGAAARVLGLSISDVEAALAQLRLHEANLLAARKAFEQVETDALPGAFRPVPPIRPIGEPTGLLDKNVGLPPRLQTGTWAARQPYRRALTPPCNHACPAGNDVRAFVRAASMDRFDRALHILLETSPFPGVCGRVCPAPCMDACNRDSFDEAVNVRELERFTADHGHREVQEHGWRDERVAVIGSGPAGLSAAYQLARLGYPVTIFEGADELGGVMRTGIPKYRLPRIVLDREIEFILEHGIDVRLRHRVSREELIQVSQEYAALFLATGLQEARSLELGADLGGSGNRVEQGIDFLDRVRRRLVRVNGERVIVVGGGNTAIDAARSARRLGASAVRIVYRRTRNEMPAIAEEIDAAIDEGIEIDELVSPLRVRSNDIRTLLTCQRMRLGEPDASGRARPVPETTEDAFFDLSCDRIILALGQSADLTVLPEGAEIRRNGTLLGLSGAPVFCGGDFSTNDGTVAAAIGNGRIAALHIHRTLTDEDLTPAPEAPVAGPEVLATHVFEHSPRQRGGVISDALRRRSFVEVHTGWTGNGDRHPAIEEASRCFSCGVCNDCNRCVDYCPEGILRRDEQGYRFDYDYCKGCGVCATQCPRGVIYMAEL
jgi:2-oxoacid:acceptor oxidoreductase gamma subunit (pyruvate/2-ketoisovalerate family)